MNVPFVDLSWQENEIKKERERRFSEVIKKTAFVLGPQVEDFERNFASYCDVREVVSVGNGTDALALIATALSIGADDEVITIPTTFIASISPFLHRGARPVFVDIDPKTRNFDLLALRQAITEKTKAIIVVDLYGDIPDMDAILKLAQDHKVLLIEDACQAHGARFKGKRAGSFGVAAAFSFYPGKNLGAYGDGGAITTNDTEFALRLRKLRNHGGVAKYEHELLGYNSRLDTLQAVVLDEKLKRLDAWNDMRRRIARRYQSELESISAIRLPPQRPDVEHVYHLFVIEMLEDDRAKFMDYMRGQNIGVGIHYPEPLHRVRAISSSRQTCGSFPAAEHYTKRIVSLPLFPGMTEEQIAQVCDAIKQYFHE